jgi:hypothetical protein
MTPDIAHEVADEVTVVVGSETTRNLLSGCPGLRVGTGTYEVVECGNIN